MLTTTSSGLVVDSTYLVELWSDPDTVVIFESELVEITGDIYVFANGVIINGTDFEAATV